MKCDRCNGTGRRMEESDNGIGWIPVKCEYCHGTGEVEMTNEYFLQTATTEQLAEVFMRFMFDADFKTRFVSGNFYDEFAEWLKEKHNG